MADTKPEKPKSARKVIITCAVTGSVHTPTMTPHLPITPDQIARESIAAAEAGASIIHLHAPRPERWAADAECRCLHAVPAAHQAILRCGHQHYHQRVARHEMLKLKGGDQVAFLL